MMTDLETIRAMLNCAGVAFHESTSSYTGDDDYRADRAGDILLRQIVETMCNEKQGTAPSHGYYNFFAEFVFHPTGAMKTIGTWE